MATITIYGNSPDPPSPAKLSSWDESFQQIDAAVARTSRNNADPTVYTDPNNAVSQAAAEKIAWGYNVMIS